jgi:hypothetical protein
MEKNVLEEFVFFNFSHGSTRSIPLGQLPCEYVKSPYAGGNSKKQRKTKKNKEKQGK